MLADAGDKYGPRYTISIYDPCGSKHYGQFHGKDNACTNGMYQAICPPLKGPGYEATIVPALYMYLVYNNCLVRQQILQCVCVCVCVGGGGGGGGRGWEACIFVRNAISQRACTTSEGMSLTRSDKSKHVCMKLMEDGAPAQNIEK